MGCAPVSPAGQKSTEAAAALAPRAVVSLAAAAPQGSIAHTAPAFRVGSVTAAPDVQQTNFCRDAPERAEARAATAASDRAHPPAAMPLQIVVAMPAIQDQTEASAHSAVPARTRYPRALRHARAASALDVLVATIAAAAVARAREAARYVHHVQRGSTEAAVGGRQQARVRLAHRGPTRRRQGLRHAARAPAAVRESTEAAVGDRQQARAL